MATRDIIRIDDNGDDGGDHDNDEYHDIDKNLNESNSIADYDDGGLNGNNYSSNRNTITCDNWWDMSRYLFPEIL